MDIISVALKRHSTKAFDASKNLPRNRPSKSKLSCNTAHPAPTPSRGILLLPARKKVKRVLPNPLPVITCSTSVKCLMPRTSWCSVQKLRWTMRLKLVVDQEDADGRFATPEAKAANDKGRKFFADMHRKDLHDDAEWMAKQVYLNVGNFLLGVAALGLDAVPIEGFDAAILDAEFGLKEKGYTSLVVVPVGHHSVEDFNATLPKSRLPQNITLTEV